MSYDKIFLVGLPASGKTTFGKQLAAEISYPFIDLDQHIEKNANMLIKEIFNEFGEDHFRQIEHDQLKGIINQKHKAVISTGGGAPCFHQNMELMNMAGVTIFINTPIETIKQRIQKESSRPLMKTNTIENLRNKRIKFYEQASFTVANYEELLLKIKSKC